jgi:hypothetical protein
MPRKKTPATARVARAALDAATLPKRLDERVRPVAAALGWAGMAALAACFALRWVDPAAWPLGLRPERMPVYATVALVAASLVGWSYMQEGQARIERRAGRQLGFVLFVALPLLATLLTLADDHALLRADTRADWSTALLVARWYTPAAVLASLWAFLASRLRGRAAGRAVRAAAYGALLAPYAVLLAALVFGFRFPWIAEPLHDTLRALGGGAAAVQLVLAWFVGATA